MSRVVTALILSRAEYGLAFSKSNFDWPTSFRTCRTLISRRSAPRCPGALTTRFTFPKSYRQLSKQVIHLVKDVSGRWPSSVDLSKWGLERRIVQRDSGGRHVDEHVIDLAALLKSLYAGVIEWEDFALELSLIGAGQS
ncbi:hypothetical protein PBRA_004393 [Plasmodiophora brassicae]|uniref:Uncharacterized protein n=1 Tax=Plasmodiophora brassicae TaxID=37360 RepID=A0A0G4IKR4_PLABS|nr:hypothetical protein PBRA_004393 [Plasmodiophora brassicae]